MLETVAANHYRLHGHIDMQGSSLLLQELMDLPKVSQVSSQTLLLDLSSLDSADSLLLAALLDLQRKMLKSNGRLRVKGLSENMLGLARVYGIETLLDNFLEDE